MKAKYKSSREASEARQMVNFAAQFNSPNKKCFEASAKSLFAYFHPPLTPEQQQEYDRASEQA